MESALEFKRLNCRELVPTDRLSCVRTFTRLLDAVAGAESGLTPDLAPEPLAARLEPWFQFCLVWGLGGPLDEPGRKKFDAFMRCAGRPRVAEGSDEQRSAGPAWPCFQALQHALVDEASCAPSPASFAPVLALLQGRGPHAAGR
jgi:hypothetical protein